MGVRHTETSLIIWSAADSPSEDTQPVSKAKAVAASEPPVFGADRWYDAGNKGCAAGPMDEIAAMMRQMQPGQTLEIFATDPTVPVDLAAWCRMTGNPLIKQQDSHFLVQHK